MRTYFAGVVWVWGAGSWDEQGTSRVREFPSPPKLLHFCKELVLLEEGEIVFEFIIPAELAVTGLLGRVVR